MVQLSTSQNRKQPTSSEVHHSRGAGSHRNGKPKMILMVEEVLRNFDTEQLVQIIMKQQQMILIQDDIITNFNKGMEKLEQTLKAALDD